MNQLKTGKYIAIKRKEKNLTQQQLADNLGVSNKTISKWETGKSLPDYSIIESLCSELDITINELLSGESYDEEKLITSAEKNSLEVLERLQKLEKEKKYLYGLLLFIMGVSFGIFSRLIEGPGFKDFISGVMLGLSIGIMLSGMYVLGRALGEKD